MIEKLYKDFCNAEKETKIKFVQEIRDAIKQQGGKLQLKVPEESSDLEDYIYGVKPVVMANDCTADMTVTPYSVELTDDDYIEVGFAGGYSDTTLYLSDNGRDDFTVSDLYNLYKSITHPYTKNLNNRG